MKISKSSAAWVSLIVCVVLAACAVLPQALRDLPELPPEFARDLEVADTAPVLMTKPARAPAPALPRPSPPPPPAAARACTTFYAGYVIYPFTVCYPPSVLFDTLKLAASETPAARGMILRLTTAP